jgi:hypothetical protein
MKSIFSAALIVVAIVAYSTANVQAKSINHLPSSVSVTAVSDTGKMEKMSKMKTKKTSKMSKSKMKMAKDSTKKM